MEKAREEKSSIKIPYGKDSPKGRFMTYFDTVLKEYQSARKIYNELLNHYDIPEGTYNDTVNAGKKNLNEMVVLAFCKTFGFDIYSIYCDKSENVPAKPTQDCDVDTELPAGFYGTFYGCFFNSTPEYYKKGLIDRFVLEVTRDKISMTLKHYALDVKQNNSYAPREIHLNGKIIHNQQGASPNGIVVMSFISPDDGCFCTMAYNKLKLNGKLFFRKGAMLIQSRGGEALPTVQSFIFTDEKIDLNNAENKTKIQGALSLTNNIFYIRKSDLYKYMDTELLREYFKKVSYNNACGEYVELDESILRDIDIDAFELYKTILLLKSESITPGLYTFPNNDRSWHYIAMLCNRIYNETQNQ